MKLKNILLNIGLLALFMLPAFMAGANASQIPSPQVYFSPRGGAEAAVVSELAKAKTEVFVMTYQLTSKSISAALVNAQMRGVKVNLIVDKGQKDVKCCARDVDKTIPVKVDSKHAIFHDKVIVIDGQTVITGSFNFSDSAEQRNAENMLVLRDPDLAKRYIANWQLHAAHAGELE